MQAQFIDGTTLYRQHSFQLPLNYQNPQGEQIQVFARELVDLAKDNQELPCLSTFKAVPVFLRQE